MKTKRMHRDVWIGLIALLFGGVMLYHAIFNMSKESAQFPIMLLCIFEFLALLCFVNGLQDSKSGTLDSENKNNFFPAFQEVKIPLIFFAMIFAYLLAIDLIGFVISSLVFAAGAMLFFSVKEKRVLILMPIGLVGFLYLLFTFILRARLP